MVTNAATYSGDRLFDSRPGGSSNRKNSSLFPPHPTVKSWDSTLK